MYRKAAVIVKNYFCVFSFLTIQRPLMHVYNSHPTKNLFDEVRGSCNDDVKVRGEKKKEIRVRKTIQNLGIYVEVETFECNQYFDVSIFTINGVRMHICPLRNYQ